MFMEYWLSRRIHTSDTGSISDLLVPSGLTVLKRRRYDTRQLKLQQRNETDEQPIVTEEAERLDYLRWMSMVTLVSLPLGTALLEALQMIC